MNRIIIAITFIALALAFTPSADACHGKGKRGLRTAGCRQGCNRARAAVETGVPLSQP